MTILAYIWTCSGLGPRLLRPIDLGPRDIPASVTDARDAPGHTRPARSIRRAAHRTALVAGADVGSGGVVVYGSRFTPLGRRPLHPQLPTGYQLLVDARACCCSYRSAGRRRSWCGLAFPALRFVVRAGGGGVAAATRRRGECGKSRRYPRESHTQETRRTVDPVRPTLTTFGHVGVECPADLRRRDHAVVNPCGGDRVADRADVSAM